MDTIVDLQVVGGGLAGLLAANRAVDAGLSVRLIEKRSPGGRAASVEREGYRLNQGPHALYLDGELNRALGRLGIDPDGAPPALRGAVGMLGDRQDLLPAGPRSLLTTSLLTGRGKRHLVRIMARLQRMRSDGLGSVTVDEWIESLTDDADLRTLLRGLVILATYNAATDRASADAALVNTQRAFGRGVRYLDGGWQQLVDALEARLGSRIEWVDGAVASVEPVGDGWACVVGGARHLARSVLLAPGAPAVVDRIVGPLPSVTGRPPAGRPPAGRPPLAELAGPPVQVAALDLGVRTEPAVGVAIGLDTARYLSVHSVAKGLAPRGHVLASLVRYLRPGDDIDPDITRAELRSHAAAAGIADDDVVMERYLHRLTVTWGMPLAASGGLAGRPAVDALGRPGLYVAGDWVGHRGLLADAAAASAEDAVAAAEARAAVGGRATVEVA